MVQFYADDMQMCSCMKSNILLIYATQQITDQIISYTYY